MTPRLLLTRPLQSSQDFAVAARDAGWRGAIVIAPLMQIVPRPLPTALLDGVQTVVLTSQHAVGALAAAPRDLCLWCVGPRTVQAARDAGFTQVQIGDGDGAALVAKLLAQPLMQPILHVHGAHLALDIAARLRDAGVQADSAVVYGQDAIALSDDGLACLAEPGPVVAPVFSPRSARLLADAVQDLRDLRAKLYLVALSPAVAQALVQIPAQSCRTAGQPDGGALLSTVLQVQAELEASAIPR